MRLLVVEDEEGLRLALSSSLTRLGYIVDTAPDGASATELLSARHYALVVLDIALPDVDGAVLCRKISQDRVGGRPRILILAARAELADRVRLLQEGADDYLRKPFALSELRARIRALVRFLRPVPGPVLVHGGLRLDESAHLVRLHGRELALTGAEYEALRYLMARPGQPVSAAELREQVLPPDSEPRGFGATMCGLAAKLTADGEDPMLETDELGYRLREAR